MRSLFRKIFPVIASIIFILSDTVFAMPEILPLEQVQSGMHGVAHTIVDNSGVIETFDVEIIGLMDNGKGSTKMIMARASGDVINRTGGILQGMSGSPVYVDGKLVGALAAGLKEMSPYTFFITPIESMLRLWEMPDEKGLNPYAKHNHQATDQEINLNDIVQRDEILLPDEILEVEPQTSLIFSGFDSAGLNFLRGQFEFAGFNNFLAASSTGTGNSLKFDATLNPGSAIGVAVVCGDFLVGATGTVTAVDGQRILGFGHPFTHAGNVNFFMTDSAVIGSVSGENGSGVKISSVGNIIGRINQDREAGVAGILGTFPSVVPISVTVRDNDLNVTDTYNATIAYNENLIAKLGASIAYTALSKTADSLAESTVSVDFSIDTNVVEGGKLSRSNIFYNASDVGQVAIVELLNALNLICSNTTTESNIFGINVNLTRDAERKTASLVSVTPDRKNAKPGETINLTVTYQPYRQPIQTVIIPYTIPILRQIGPMALDVHGGSLVPVTNQNVNTITPTTVTPEQAYNEKIRNLITAGKNNQIVVDIGNAPSNLSERERQRELQRIRKLQEKLRREGNQNIRIANSRVDTDYIIDNVIQVIINVDKP